MKELIPRYNQIKGFVMGCCTSAKKMHEITSKLVSVVRSQNHLFEEVPFSLIEFRHSLLMKKESCNPPLISKTEFEVLAKKHDITNVGDTLKKLCNLGITLTVRNQPVKQQSIRQHALF